ncbi:cardiolipin synthase [Acuticoccus sediminis]|uniref:Cardiolipin synthase n=1 Tax=Acuticoccus sediminis TaxID=2184697 RepID=A0A8B2NI03_9HYPH|nr:cardiolipin synthase [Acuticoccus sediminis]RAH96567.1 cardiolipin synthase [Acuticoccus sediminis]
MNLVFWSGIVAAAHAVAVVAGTIAAVRAAQHAHTAQGAVAWAIALILLPWVALPAYLFIGPPKPGAFEDDQATLRASAYAGLFSGALPDAAIAPVSPTWQVLERFAPTPILYSGAPRLLVDGEAVFQAVFDLIAKAERHIVVQFYIFRDDGLGRRLHEALVARAGEGLTVRVLYDGIGARSVPDAYWDGLREAGVDVKDFHLVRRLPKMLRLNYRNHRKLVAADGRIAIVGGPNVGDEYLGLDPAFGDWRDTAVEITGPAAQVAQAAFDVDWLWAGGTQAPTKDEAVPLHEGTTRTPVLLLPTGPADPLPACSLALMHLITAAKERLWLTTPYFVPDLDVLSALKLAALKGVDVRVMIPDRPDHTIVWLAGFAYADEILRAGVKLYRYKDGFMHQKVVLVDDTVSAIGTVNFDNRSLHLNFENTVLIFERRFAAETAAMLEADFARSHLVNDEGYAAFSPVVRALAPATRLLAPLL